MNVDTYIGNGPFKLAEWKHDDVMKLVKNENYYDADKVKLDGIDYVFIVESSTSVSAFESGEIDYMEAVPAENRSFTRSKRSELQNCTIVEHILHVFNINKEPVNNPKVRRALALAINRKDIVEQVTKARRSSSCNRIRSKRIPMSDGTNRFPRKKPEIMI